ncbi:hypothetical protein [Lentilactobacillus dabitei]|uniref:hypothetical protein n=1 Tax=Lentilactobacillus dabitei TaxID=2831523 RepID=UPI001C26B0E4|nr:hypothetical protein [Lentilactobacillus dabitei]
MRTASVTSSKMISAVKALFPQLNIIPTGSINLDNLDKWFTAGPFVSVLAVI